MVSSGDENATYQIIVNKSVPSVQEEQVTSARFNLFQYIKDLPAKESAIVGLIIIQTFFSICLAFIAHNFAKKYWALTKGDKTNEKSVMDKNKEIVDDIEKEDVLESKENIKKSKKGKRFKEE